MNFGEGQLNVKDLLDALQGTTKYGGESVKRAINSALRRLWPMVFLVRKSFYRTSYPTTTSTSSSTVSLPSDCSGVIEDVFIGQRGPMQKVDISSFSYDDENFTLPTENPSGYDLIHDGDNTYSLQFSTIPKEAESIKVWYYFHPSKLVNATDRIVFPNGYEDLVVLLACLILMHRTQANRDSFERDFNALESEFKMNFGDSQSQQVQNIDAVPTLDTDYLQKEPRKGARFYGQTPDYFTT
jgi:hypothetical protein